MLLSSVSEHSFWYRLLLLYCYFQAARKAIVQAKSRGIANLELRTDSQFLINSECPKMQMHPGFVGSRAE